jgi:hypothetical protein
VTKETTNKTTENQSVIPKDYKHRIESMRQLLEYIQVNEVTTRSIQEVAIDRVRAEERIQQAYPFSLFIVMLYRYASEIPVEFEASVLTRKPGRPINQNCYVITDTFEEDLTDNNPTYYAEVDTSTVNEHFCSESTIKVYVAGDAEKFVSTVSRLHNWPKTWQIKDKRRT